MPPTDHDLFHQARQAFRAGDIARGGRIVHGVLKREINHPEAWSLLYTYLGRGKSFDEFQESFVRTYYPAQLEEFKNRRTSLVDGPYRRVSLTQDQYADQDASPVLPDFPRPNTGPAPISRKIKEKKEGKAKFGLQRLFSGSKEKPRKRVPAEPSPAADSEKKKRRLFRLPALRLPFGKRQPQDEEQAAHAALSPEPPPAAPAPELNPAPAPASARPRQPEEVASLQPKGETVDLLVKKMAAEKISRPEPARDLQPRNQKAPLMASLGKRHEIRLVIADDIELTRENIRKLLLFEPSVDVVGVAANGREAVHLVTETRPDVVLLDINMPDMDGLQALTQIRQNSPLTQVVMLTVQDDPGYLREALQLGARDYLIKPPMIDDLLDTVRKASEIGKTERERIDRLARQQAATLEAVTGKERGYTIAVYSPKGGVGCTVLASNLAVALAGEKESVVLVDCNLQYGGVGLLFNQTARTSIADIAPFASELDKDVVENACALHAGSGVRMLLAPNRLGRGEVVTGPQIASLIDFLGRHYSYVVVDTSSALDDLTVSVLDAVDQVLLVTTQDIPSINDIRRVLDLAPAIGISPDKIALVLNQYHTRINITPEKITANLGREFASVVPLDNSTVIPSINGGSPFMATGQGQTSPVGQAVRSLAGMARALAVEAEENAA